MSLTATLVMVSPGSSRTCAGPPTSTSPVYVGALMGLRSRSVSGRRYGPAMDASGGPVPAHGPVPVVGLPATELAARVRSGELSAVDVTWAHLDHIAAVDARIGAFRVVRTEAA